jgi:hypothetical protein
MTRSQMWSAAGTLAAAVSALVPRLLPLSDVLPPALARWLPVAGVVAGVVVAAMNQSLSPAHTSIPIEQAAAIADELPLGAGDPLADKALARIREVVAEKGGESTV